MVATVAPGVFTNWKRQSAELHIARLFQVLFITPNIFSYQASESCVAVLSCELFSMLYKVFEIFYVPCGISEN